MENKDLEGIPEASQAPAPYAIAEANQSDPSRQQASPCSRWRTDPLWARDLRAFVKESNRIEGIKRPPHDRELDAHDAFLAADELTVADVEALVSVLAPRRPLRDRIGLNVRVGDHLPPQGGPGIRDALEGILWEATGWETAYRVHHKYETLHPFMDGNGRSGRALWLWMMLRQGRDPYAMRRGFLHTWYYQSLAAGNGR